MDPAPNRRNLAAELARIIGDLLATSPQNDGEHIKAPGELSPRLAPFPTLHNRTFTHWVHSTTAPHRPCTNLSYSLSQFLR